MVVDEGRELVLGRIGNLAIVRDRGFDSGMRGNDLASETGHILAGFGSILVEVLDVCSQHDVVVARTKRNGIIPAEAEVPLTHVGEC